MAGMRKILVRVELSRLPVNKFRERAKGTWHIANRFIPFECFNEFKPAIVHSNSVKTVEYVFQMFALMNSYNGKKEIFDEAMSMPVFMVVKK